MFLRYQYKVIKYEVRLKRNVINNENSESNFLRSPWCCYHVKYILHFCYVGMTEISDYWSNDLNSISKY